MIFLLLVRVEGEVDHRDEDYISQSGGFCFIQWSYPLELVGLHSKYTIVVWHNGGRLYSPYSLYLQVALGPRAHWPSFGLHRKTSLVSDLTTYTGQSLDSNEWILYVRGNTLCIRVLDVHFISCDSQARFLYVLKQTNIVMWVSCLVWICYEMRKWQCIQRRSWRLSLWNFVNIKSRYSYNNFMVIYFAQ